MSLDGTEIKRNYNESAGKRGHTSDSREKPSQSLHHVPKIGIAVAILLGSQKGFRSFVDTPLLEATWSIKSVRLVLLAPGIPNSPRNFLAAPNLLREPIAFSCRGLLKEIGGGGSSFFRGPQNCGFPFCLPLKQTKFNAGCLLSPREIGVVSYRPAELRKRLVADLLLVHFSGNEWLTMPRLQSQEP